MILGILILVYGILLLFETILPTLDFSLTFYLTVSIFVYGLYNIIKNEKIDFKNSFLTIIGLILSLMSLDVLPIFLASTFVPILVILLGIIIIYNTSVFKKPYGMDKNNDKKYNAILSESIQKITDEDFRGAESFSIFGNIILDLSELNLKEDANLIVYTIFGESTVILSDKYNVKYNATSILGSDNNKVESTDKKNKKTLNLNCITILGGATIKQNDKD